MENLEKVTKERKPQKGATAKFLSKTDESLNLEEANDLRTKLNQLNGKIRCSESFCHHMFDALAN